MLLKILFTLIILIIHIKIEDVVLLKHWNITLKVILRLI